MVQPTDSQTHSLGLRTLLLLAAAGFPFLLLSTARGQDSAPAEESTQQLESSSELSLSGQQELVAERFARLEDLLLRRSEIEKAENPARSALLQQAARLGKQNELADLLARAASSLNQDQFTEAIDQQKLSTEFLQELLELLQSENRERRIREDRDNVRRWIEDTNRLLRMQGSLRGRTAGGQDAQQAAQDQQRLEDKANDIAKDLGGDESDESDDSESTEDSASEENSAESNGDKSEQGSQSDESDGKAEEGQSSTEDGSDTESKGASSQENQESSDEGDTDASSSASESEEEQQDSASDSQDSQSGENSGDQKQPSEGESSESQSSESQSSEDQQSSQSQSGESGEPQAQQPKTPAQKARQRIREAQKRMQEARKKLLESDEEGDEAKREEAIEEQLQAEENLRAAVEELKQILRQLREEEIERSLASLEDRLRRMLELQNKVLDETQRLLEIAGEGEPNRQVTIRATNLAKEERKILDEGERAFLLLREEGSSAAFPEAITQLNEDIAQVVQRLEQGKADRLTETLEQEITIAIEEMIDALVKIQKSNEEKKRQQRQSGQGQQMQSGETPLVDRLAELKLILTLQTRINKRTDTLSKMLDDPGDVVGQVESDEILSALQMLSDRQAKIQNVTRNIADEIQAQQQ